MNWISLKKSTPQENEKVLVYPGLDVAVYRRYKEGYPLEFFLLKRRETDQEMSYDNVNHWMRLDIPQVYKEI